MIGELLGNLSVNTSMILCWGATLIREVERSSMSANPDMQAEALLQKNPLDIPVMDTLAVQKLVRELLERQLELEQENQELRQTQSSRGAPRESPTDPNGSATLAESERDIALFNQQWEQLIEQHSAELRESETRFRATVNSLLVGVVVHAVDLSVVFSNQQACHLLGLSLEQMRGEKPMPPDWQFLHEDRSVLDFEDYPLSRAIATGKSVVYECLGVRHRDSADITWLTGSATPVFSQANVLDRIVVNFMDVTELKRLQQALQKRVLTLTHPLDQPEGIAFDDLFDLPEIQRIQDEFSMATGVASIITDADGIPITQPSNFVDLCRHIIQSGEEGCVNCFTSRVGIGQLQPQGPIIRQCPGSGLWDAGASIVIGGRHVATWLIGQVREESWPQEQVCAYARKLGADEAAVVEAFYRVPVMTLERFSTIAQALFTLARQLSNGAYQNIQQARFISEQKSAEQALQESEEKYRKLFESESDAIIIFDGETQQFVDVNDAAIQLYGYTREEFLRLTHRAITAEPDVAEQAIPRVLAATIIPTFVSQHRKKDGTIFPTEITAFTVSLQGRPVICGVIRDNTERVAYEHELENNHGELRRLASELSLAEQRERERIGRELHDGVSQLLISSLLRIDVLKASPLSRVAVEALDTIGGIVEKALDETRSLTFELSCPMLNELGLSAALEELCSSMRHEYSIHIEFKGTTAILPISMDSKIALYRSTRELLINVMKHSDANWGRVHLEQIDNQVRICVADDGVGFDAKMAGKGFSPTGGFGLFNISEYIRHAGGNLQIDSILGEGTEAVLSVPLEQIHD